jgi:alpha-L-fucosidase
MKIRILVFTLALLLTGNCFILKAQTSNNMQWWKEGKFGLFLHWGLYSIAAGEWRGKPAKGNEHLMLGEKIPLKEYAAIAKDFNPIQFDADQWVKDAKDAGMKYIVITAKHHDGFAMYHSPGNDYNIVQTTPYAQDPMIALAAACKKYSLKLCFYYSLGRDWADPDASTKNGYRSNTWDYPNEQAKDFAKYFDRKVKPQVKELLTQYGPVGLIWFDTPEEITEAQSIELRKLIKDLQPDCIINSRIGNGKGDYEVSEQKIIANAETNSWESCVTMSGKWGYSKFDKAWKTPEILVRHLVETVCKGGNFLLNIGPMPSGELPVQSRINLDAIGLWMKKNSEAIYGTKPWILLNEGSEKQENDTRKAEGKSDNDFTSKKTTPDLYFNTKKNCIYIFARSWHQKTISSKSLGTIKNIKQIQLLGSEEKIKWQLRDGNLLIILPDLSITQIPVYVFKIVTK